jgi:hypothetical protein
MGAPSPIHATVPGVSLMCDWHAGRMLTLLRKAALRSTDAAAHLLSKEQRTGTDENEEQT